MKTKYSNKWIVCAIWWGLFVLWTVVVAEVDVQSIGPNGSTVGLAGLNQWVHKRLGVHLSLYLATDWLSVLPLGCVLFFAGMGLWQWIRRKSIWRVDPDIWVLGGFYLLTAAMFVLFEVLAVNYRPILLEGVLEVSYPSSTTLLVLTVMPTARLQLQARGKQGTRRTIALLAIDGFTLCMVAARLLSGVHWFTDIIGGILLAGGLVSLYEWVCGRIAAESKP